LESFKEQVIDRGDSPFTLQELEKAPISRGPSHAKLMQLF